MERLTALRASKGDVLTLSEVLVLVVREGLPLVEAHRVPMVGPDREI